MGGQAIKNTPVRRYQLAEYEQLKAEVLTQLQADFPECRMAAIPAYRSKTSFGDLDILFETPSLAIDLKAYLQERFQSPEIVRNSHVFSFAYREFQVDLIGSSSEDFEISLHYFSWNDLGNIIGRLYHKMGFKYGHDGLHFLFKADNYQFGEICLSKEIHPILAFADLDAERFLAGFDTLEDIFRYAASSSFFNKDIYLFENRNHASRIRDRKRPTYNALLQWLETQANLPAYPWASVKEQGGRQTQTIFLERAFEFFPEFQTSYLKMQQAFEVWQTVREKFNGRLVQTWTGLENQALGQLMQQLKAQGSNEFGDFQQWIYTQPHAEIERWVKAQV
ncbi:hypothetical protein [uncultured Thiothrix sp.]|uniref:hypothetical protein n=1 Tax=uncultured Thiothrix sp. TaxID=223185 RepID=UPI00260E286B|nr:hypothetical protein [uncultured Thiothrix sp.]